MFEFQVDCHVTENTNLDNKCELLILVKIKGKGNDESWKDKKDGGK